jgi:hypothetical protein
VNGSNGAPHDASDDDREMAFALVDRALTAIGGLETDDPVEAIDTVVAMYERALTRLHH